MTGPKRSLRQCHSLAVSPYDPKSRKPDDGQAQNPEPPRVAEGLCPRRGRAHKASRDQPQAAWETMAKPHKAARTTVVNFLYTLTAYDKTEDIARSVPSMFVPGEAMFKAIDGSLTLFQLASMCMEADRRKCTSDFKAMITLIRLSFECARSVNVIARNMYRSTN